MKLDGTKKRNLDLIGSRIIGLVTLDYEQNIRRRTGLEICEIICYTWHRGLEEKAARFYRDMRNILIAAENWYGKGFIDDHFHTAFCVYATGSKAVTAPSGGANHSGNTGTDI